MLKKYALLVPFMVLAVLALSAFNSGGFQPVVRNAYSLSYIQARAPLTGVGPSNDEFNFRIAHTWNGYYIPSVDVTGFVANTAALPSDGGTNFRLAHTWNGYYIPSMDVTGVLDSPGAYPPNLSFGTLSYPDYANHKLTPIFADYASH